MQQNPHFFDLLSEFSAARVRYLVVGAYVLSYYGRPRTTGDLDLWVEPAWKNASACSGRSRASARLSKESLQWISGRRERSFKIGVVPSRIDILTSLTGVAFATAWKNRRQAHYGGLSICLLAERDFIRNKRAVGRTRDLADAEEVEKLLARRTKRKAPADE